MKHLLIALLIAPFAAVAEGADVFFLGEVHDNPAHHVTQAEMVARIAPTALVFEMLTPEQAARVTADLRGDAAALGAALDWAGSGWPAFSMYYPIFAAAPDAAVHGAAIPRDQARAAMADGVARAFGPDAARFGLLSPLPEAQQTTRQALQLTAHCDALPADLLPMMVDVQRLRDAALARAALEALQTHGPPVVVITGNGHARRDWGAPAALLTAAPDTTIFALGQGERALDQGIDAPPPGQFDQTVMAPPVARKDPCAAFQ